MNSDFQISRYCIIRNHAIERDDTALFNYAPCSTGDFLSQAYRYFLINYPKFYKMDTLSKLGFLSAELLLDGTQFIEKYAGDEVGIILMNSASSLDTDRKHQDSVSDRNQYFPSPAIFVYTLPNIMIGEISIRHKITGEGCFFVLEQFDADFIYSSVTGLLNNSVVRSCIAGWVEKDGENYEAVVYFIEKRVKPNNGFANFEPDNILRIYNKGK
jgi:hypothetical protein